jgi:hypothetical protein
VRRQRNLKRAGLAAIVAAIAALAIVAITAGGGSKTARTASTPRTAAVTTPASTTPAAGGGPALTPAEYRKQANAICNALSLTPPPGTASLQQAAPVIAAGVAKASSALGRLRALRPPNEIASQVNDALGIMQQVVDVAGEAATAAQMNDQASVKTDYEELGGLATAGHGIWKQIGVPQC